VAALAGCAHLSTPASAHYAIGPSYSLPGPGRWDLLAVDAARGHLFVTRSDHVQVMDLANGHLLATIDGTAGVHGIAIGPASGYATNGKSNSVTEFDLDTFRRVRDVPVSGQSPDATLYDDFSHRLFVFNAHSNNASVIDPVIGKEISVIAFDGNPELAASDGKGRIFVNIEDKAEVAEINVSTLQITHTWPLPGCEEPSGLAMDIAHERLFSVCQNKTMVITDATSGRQVARVAIDDGPDGAAFDARTQSALSPNGKSGTLTVVHEDDPEHFSVAQTLITQPSARTIAMDAVTQRLYLPAARFGPQPQDPHVRPDMIPDSFRIMTVESAGRAHR
jgi:DNA-binding beta-propeller fold protein YncE